MSPYFNNKNSQEFYCRTTPYNTKVKNSRPPRINCYSQKKGAIWKAVKNNVFTTVGKLIAVKDINAKYHYHKDHWTFLQLAIHKGYPNIVDFLIGKGANVQEVTTEKNWSVLHLACQPECSTTILQSLLEKGAKIDQRTRDGWTALHWACAIGDGSKVLCLQHFSNEESYIHKLKTILGHHLN